MRSSFKKLDTSIQNHLERILETLNSEGKTADRELLASHWLEKERIFNREISSIGLKEVNKVNNISEGFLALTFSGSLLALGPLRNGKRSAVYVSIGLRSDVPERSETDNAVINGPVIKGSEIFFNKGPVVKTSPVHKLAVFKKNTNVSDKQKLLENTTETITRELQTLNETMLET